MPLVAKIMFWLKGIWGVPQYSFASEIVNVNLLDNSPININLFNCSFETTIMPTPMIELLIYKNELNIDLMKNEPLDVKLNG